MTWSLTIATPRGDLDVLRLGEGPAVLLLHGIPGSGASWSEVAGRLATAHEVIVPDLLGFGGSARPTRLDELHAEAQAQAVAAALEMLEVRRAVVAGHDFGGPVAITLHRLRPSHVAGLALFATNAFTDTPVPFPLSLTKAPLVGGLAEQVLFSRLGQSAMLRTGTGNGSRLDPRTHLGDRGQQASTRRIFAGSLRELRRLYEPVETELGRVGVPALVGWGDADPFFPLRQGERTAAAIPGARLRVYPGAGHFLPEERPEELARDLAELVERTRTASHAGHATS